MAENEFPKVDGDVLYASEANDNQRNVSICESINQNTILSENATVTDKTYTYADTDIMSDSTGYNDTIDTGNSTSQFDTDKYWGMITSADESNNSETSRWEDSFATTKTITLASDKRVTQVDNEIKSQIVGGTIYCRMKFNYSDSSNGYSSSQSTPNTSYVARSYTNPSTEKLVTSIEVQCKGGNQTDRNCYEHNDVVTAFTASNSVVQTNSKTFSSNVNSIFINANKILNGSSTITADISSDGGTAFEKTSQNFDEWIALDGDNTDIVVKFNLNVDGSDTPELYGYSYIVR